MSDTDAAPESKRRASALSRAELWGRVEATTRIASLVAIPVVLAIVGWMVQDQLAARTVSKDYVQLAVSILSQPKQADTDPALRSWAVELLNENSPVKFSTAIATQLKSGAATLPIDQSDNLRALAQSYYNTGEYAKAEAALQQALVLQEKAFGPEHPAVSDSLSDLGTVYFAKGDFSRAEALFQRALAIREKALGSSDPGIARILSALAAISDAKGDAERAQTLRQRADVIYRHAATK
jgi:tetratricopeptide (TPR) repeat protein